MAEELLHVAHVGAALDEVRGVGVAQVWRRMCGVTGTLRPDCGCTVS